MGHGRARPPFQPLECLFRTAVIPLVSLAVQRVPWTTIHEVVRFEDLTESLRTDLVLRGLFQMRTEASDRPDREYVAELQRRLANRLEEKSGVGCVSYRGTAGARPVLEAGQPVTTPATAASGDRVSTDADRGRDGLDRNAARGHQERGGSHPYTAIPARLANTLQLTTREV